MLVVDELKKNDPAAPPSGAACWPEACSFCSAACGGWQVVSARRVSETIWKMQAYRTIRLPGGAREDPWTGKGRVLAENRGALRT